MGFLEIHDRSFCIFGVANRKSVGYHIGKTLEQQGARVAYIVRSQQRKTTLQALLSPAPIYVCDVEDKQQIESLPEQFDKSFFPLQGIAHSIAFAKYYTDSRPFYDTERQDFLQATSISAFSWVEIAKIFKPFLDKKASCISIGISSQVMAERYGYMSPIKAMLESITRFLAKSFSHDSEIRFNCIGAGPLKTSASAGIPGFLDNYLWAEKMTLRKRALSTQEVANVALFLLSSLSSGINAQTIVVNAGMDLNYFDQSLQSSNNL